MFSKGGNEYIKDSISRVTTHLENILKSQGKLREILIFVEKTWKTQGKSRIWDMIANKNTFRWIFLSWVAQGKNLKCPENLREFSFSKMWPPWFHVQLTADICQHGLWQAYQLNCYFEYLNICFIWPLAERKQICSCSGSLISTLRDHFATSIKLLGLLPIIWCIYQISALNIYAGPSN